MLLNTLVLLAAIEIAAVGVLSVSRSMRPVENAAARAPLAGAQSYAGRDWAPQFLAEFWQGSNQPRYTPFTLTRQAPFSGRFVNVDRNGHRFTPGADCGPGAYTVTVFGGSAAWGWGVVDSATIPALLQRSWPARGRGVCVRNAGQLAHVSTQEVIELLRQIQNGSVPDLAIFYHMHNDLHSAAAERLAGVHMFVEATARKFEQQPRSSRRPPAIEWITGTGTLRLLRRLIPERVASTEPTGSAAEAMSPAAIERLADDVVQVYLTNYRTVAALSREYGFSYAFFWQPELSLSAKPRTDPEKAADIREGDDYLALLRAVRLRLEAAHPSMPNAYDLSHVFDNETNQIFFDHVHITPEANAIAARRILERLGLTSPPGRP